MGTRPELSAQPIRPGHHVEQQFLHLLRVTACLPHDPLQALVPPSGGALLDVPAPALKNLLLRDAVQPDVPGQVRHLGAQELYYGKESGIFLLIGMMGAIYAVSAPLILVFTAVYFSFAFIVFKHHLLYVYGRAYESGGVYWPILFTRMMILLISMACLTGVQMIIKKALWPALAVLPAPFLLLYFMSACNKQFHNQVNFVPLEIAKAMPRADVPRELYIAPELARSLPGGTPSQERRGKATVCRCGRCRSGVR